MGVTTPRTEVQGFSVLTERLLPYPSPKAPSEPRKTLTPYLGGGISAQTLPRVFVWSFTHRTTQWNPLLQVSRCTGNAVPKEILAHICRPLCYVRHRRMWGSPCILVASPWLGENRGIIAPPHPLFSLKTNPHSRSLSGFGLKLVACCCKTYTSR